MRKNNLINAGFKMYAFFSFCYLFFFRFTHSIGIIKDSNPEFTFLCILISTINLNLNNRYLRKSPTGFRQEMI